MPHLSFSLFLAPYISERRTDTLNANFQQLFWRAVLDRKL